MRWLALIVLLAVAGCGGLSARVEQECGPNASCAAQQCDPRLSRDAPALTKDSHPQIRNLPPVVGSVPVTWTCDFGTRQPARLQVRQGIPPSVAVFSRNATYVAPDAPLKAAENPLHTYFYSAKASPPRRGCRSRTVEGPISSIDWFGVLFIDDQKVSIASATRVLTARVDGVPRLPHGRWVKVDALKCPKRVALVARSISD